MPTPYPDNLLPELAAAPLQALQHPLFAEHQVQVRVLRLDLMHPDLGGNKWFKLQANLAAIRSAGWPRVVSFGGAWSNHLRALAAAGREFGFATTGFIRGEATDPLNPVLDFAWRCGMELRFLSRSDYRRREDPDFVQHLIRPLGPAFLIPEGGSNELGVSGCERLARMLHWSNPVSSAGIQAGESLAEGQAGARFAWLACGTGATMAGLLRGLGKGNPQQVKVRGVAVLKAPGYLQRQVCGWLPAELSRRVDWQILEDYHCGGYARMSTALRSTLTAMQAATGLPLEPVYTGKLMLALTDQIGRGLLPPGSEVILLHTGGIPGTGAR